MNKDVAHLKDYFSIGEISALLHLSSHTLRYYDKIGLLHPAITNEQTGYRMYAYDQIFALERIKYLQYIGLSLEDIRVILADSSAATLTKYLNQRQGELQSEMKHISVLLNTVNKSLAYYTHCEDGLCSGVPYKTDIPERYLFAEPYFPGEPINRTAGYRLMTKKAEPEFAGLDFLRQIGFVLDYPALMEGRFVPTHYFMLLETRPEKPSPEILTVPAGDWLCFRTTDIQSPAGLPRFRRYLTRQADTPVALACEYEQNLDSSCESWLESMFEIQILL